MSCRHVEHMVSQIGRSRGVFSALVLTVAYQLHASGNWWGGSCPINKVYSSIRLNGKSNLSLEELTQAGVSLCARHIGRPDTYEHTDGCSHPDVVFSDGKLPDFEVGDVRALLLLRCPAVAYPNGRDMIRVTCQRIYEYNENGDGDIVGGPFKEGFGLFFDGVSAPLDCVAPAASTPMLNSGAHRDMSAGLTVTRTPRIRKLMRSVIEVDSGASFIELGSPTDEAPRQEWPVFELSRQSDNSSAVVVEEAQKNEEEASSAVSRQSRNAVSRQSRNISAAANERRKNEEAAAAEEEEELHLAASPAVLTTVMAAVSAAAQTTVQRSEDEGRDSSKHQLVVPTLSSHSPTIGLPGHLWHPMAWELELYASKETLANEPTPGDLAYRAVFTEPLVRRALLNASAALKNRSTISASVSSAHSPTSGLSSYTPADLTQLDRKTTTSNSETGISADASISSNTERMRQLTTLAIKRTHNDEEQLFAWNWEVESAKGMMEISTPVNLTEEEVSYTLGATNLLDGPFVPGEAFQFHIEANCLLKDSRRLVALLLIWERFHSTLESLLSIDRRSRWSYAATIANKNPELLNHLQARWLGDPEAQAEPIDLAFRRLESSIRFPTADGKLHSDLKLNLRNGYRTFALNLCHLLDIDCCVDCEKNLVKKFGAIEFRVFDSQFGHGLLLMSALGQRLIQSTCAISEFDDPSLRNLLMLPGVQPAPDATALLEFLRMDPEEFCTQFHRRSNYSDGPCALNRAARMS